METLRDVFDYRLLKVRRDVLRAPLGPEDQTRLTLLEQRLEFPATTTGVPLAHGYPRRRYFRFDVVIEAWVELGARRERVAILNIGGGGLVITRVPDARRGDIALVGVCDEGDRALRLPVQVVRELTTAHGSALGCAFVGMPRVEAKQARDPFVLRAASDAEVDDADLPVPRAARRALLMSC